MLKNGFSHGVIRVYGSFGFLMAALVAGIILDVMGIHTLFLLLTLIFVGPLLASFFLPEQQKAPAVRGRWQEMAILLHDRVFLLFLLFCGLGYKYLRSVQYLLRSLLARSGVCIAAIGLASGFATLSELPVMMLSGLFMKRFGIKWFLLIGLGVALVRWLAYAAFPHYDVLLVFTVYCMAFHLLVSMSRGSHSTHSSPSIGERASRSRCCYNLSQNVLGRATSWSFRLSLLKSD